MFLPLFQNTDVDMLVTSGGVTVMIQVYYWGTICN